MDRPKLTQGHLNRLALPSDMPDLPWVQWRVENLDEFARFLEDEIVNKFNARVFVKNIPGNQLLIQTHVINSDMQLSPGDCLVVHTQNGRPRLGIVRARDSVPFREADGLKDHGNVVFLHPKDKIISH